jgi:hypothetical protein
MQGATELGWKFDFDFYLQILFANKLVFSNKICLIVLKGFSQPDIIMPKECPPTGWFSNTPRSDGA